MANITIYDVAREAGVSMATVSRVMNGTAVVKKETEKKVRDAISKLSYRPNAVARGLASKKTKSIGVIVPDVSVSYMSEIVRGIEDIAAMYRYHIILTNSDAQSGLEVDLIETMWEKQVDGLLFMSDNISREVINTFEAAQLPVVLCASSDEKELIPSVNIDNRKASYDATNFLLGEGSKKVLFIGGPRHHTVNGRPRYQGYEDAMKERNIEFDVIECEDLRYESGLKCMRERIAKGFPIESIVAASDELAVAAIHACQDGGLHVPQDVKVIGFENSRLASMVRPELTTIAQPMYDVGAVAMRLLTKFLTDEPVDDFIVKLPHDITVRQST